MSICKGQVYRCEDPKYHRNKQGELVFNKKFVFIPGLSCSDENCESCKIIEDMLKEEQDIYYGNTHNTAFYNLVRIVMWEDPKTGIATDFSLQFQETWASKNRRYTGYNTGYDKGYDEEKKENKE